MHFLAPVIANPLQIHSHLWAGPPNPTLQVDLSHPASAAVKQPSSCILLFHALMFIIIGRCLGGCSIARQFTRTIHGPSDRSGLAVRHGEQRKGVKAPRGESPSSGPT